MLQGLQAEAFINKLDSVGKKGVSITKCGINFCNVLAILSLTINNHMLYKYKAQAGEEALQWF